MARTIHPVELFKEDLTLLNKVQSLGLKAAGVKPTRAAIMRRSLRHSAPLFIDGTVPFVPEVSFKKPSRRGADRPTDM